MQYVAHYRNRFRAQVGIIQQKIKTEKLKSRSMMEQLLLLMTSQMEELISTFNERCTQLRTEHDSVARKLQHMSDSERIDNQKSIKRLLRSHDNR